MENKSLNRPRRVQIQVDRRIDDILKKNRYEGEADTACLTRLIFYSDDIKNILDKLSINSDASINNAQKHLDESRRILNLFLDKIRNPIDQIGERLNSIDEAVHSKK